MSHPFSAVFDPAFDRRAGSPIPQPGGVPLSADLPTLRRMMGVTSVKDDELLQIALDVAWAWVLGRIMAGHETEPTVHYAVLLLAARYYKRRQSPEGAAGFGGEGLVVRILNSDPDVRALLEHHTNQLDIGIG